GRARSESGRLHQARRLQVAESAGGGTCNNFSRPHFHPNDRFIYVLKGTWWNGTGTAFDPPNTVPMRAGTLVTHHAKGIHWDGAKEEDAMLLIIGDGPATNTPAQQTEGKFDGKLNAQFVTFKTPDQFAGAIQATRPRPIRASWSAIRRRPAST